MKKFLLRSLCMLCAMIMMLGAGATVASAAEYKRGANTASPSYMSGKYYATL